MMKNINTYGELLEEIKRVEKSIENVRKGFNYEQGDEMDLGLYLIQLKKTKRKNEKQYRIKQEIGVYQCEKCESIHLDIIQTTDVATLSYDYFVECMDCGYEKKIRIGKQELISILDKVDDEFKSIWDY